MAIRGMGYTGKMRNGGKNGRKWGNVFSPRPSLPPRVSFHGLTHPMRLSILCRWMYEGRDGRLGVDPDLGFFFARATRPITHVGRDENRRDSTGLPPRGAPLMNM
jgi:hypothetical protein